MTEASVTPRRPPGAPRRKGPSTDTRARAAADTRARAATDTRARFSADTRARAATDTRARFSADTRARASTGSGREGKPALQVLERTFAILECFDEVRPEWTTSDIARALDLPIPTAHRILGALRRLGYVAQDSRNKRFRLGAAALALGTKARAVADLRTVALDPLRRLSQQLNETALLTAMSPDRRATVCLERVESTHSLRLSLEPGRQMPLHAGASQKALFAFLPQPEIDELLRGRFERLCRSTITDRRKLRDELEAVRERGFATSFEETNVGVWGVAVPVLSDSDIVCAVGVAGPSARLTTDLVRRSLRRTCAAAAEIAEGLGLTIPEVRVNAVSLDLAGAKRR
jgi:DNA-binding IclR family transcriptional regulator